MGIKGLNIYMKKNCYKGIEKIKIDSFRGKKIVIDISIYMYKYKAEGILYEGIYEMLSILLSFDIIPIIIFDGIPPEEKQDEINARHEKKIEARKRYNELSSTKDENLTAQELDQKLKEISRSMVTITKNNKEQIKNLLRMMGINYYESEGEADIVCAYFVNNHLAYAAMSEDMDLFVYGTERVIRHIDIMKKEFII